MNCPPASIVGERAAQFFSACGWNAHSSAITTDAVSERPASSVAGSANTTE